MLNGLPTTIDTLALLHVFIPSIRTVLRWDICNYPAMEAPKQRARFALILNRAARAYRDDDGRPWLEAARPLVTMLPESPRLPYLIT